MALAAAVASAVLSGALLVGDSVRGSLRALTLDRLGTVDSALIGDRFFRSTLFDEFVALPDSGDRFQAAAPAIVLRGSAVHADSGARASQLGIHGIDRRFARMFGADLEAELARRDGQIFPSVVINESLRRELDAQPGDALLLSFGRWSHVPRDTLMGDKDPEDLLRSVRLTLTAVIPDRGLGRFAVVPDQHQPLNAFVALDDLQRSLEQEGRINAFFMAHAEAQADPASDLARVLRLEDLGLAATIEPGHLAIESEAFVLRPDVDQAIGDVAARLGLPLLRVQSYLANEIRAGDRSTPYSLVAALDAPGGPGGALTLAGGGPAPLPSDDEILLNRWTADDLGLEVGDTVRLAYYVVGPREELTTEQAEFKVAGVVALEGLGADPSLTPRYPGIQEAGDMSSWDPPFPVDLSLIRPEDEEYWDRYGATPKAFLSAETGRRLWSTRYGSTTSVRVGTAEGVDFQAALFASLSLDSFGFRFRALREQGLAAARGATDFAMLFVSFSFFLIISSALLVGLLFGLGVERRAREIGLLLAVGYRARSVRNGLLVEGTVLAAVGGLLGLIGGVGYAGLMMAGLRSLWLPAVGSSELYLHVEPISLVMGWIIAVAVVLVSITLTARRLRRVPPPLLLAGSLARPWSPGRRRLTAFLAFGGLAAGLGLPAYGLLAGATDSAGLAFGSGTALLIAGLALFAMWCRGSRVRRGGLRPGTSLAGLAARNSAWNPGRSILSVALVGSASFVIIMVASMHTELGEELESRDSGSGGFSLVAETDVPLLQDLNRAQDRFDLGFSDADAADLGSMQAIPFRLLPGDDASCLNLYQPERPRILGVPDELIRRGGFRFRSSVELPEGAASAWELLQEPLEPGVIPAIGDYNSAKWILKKDLGDEVELQDELGRPLRLRFVALLQGSVFQSELLIDEQAFLQHFPGRTGYSYFLIDSPFENSHEIGQTLERALGPFGFDAVTTREKLAGYEVVQNTYLTTFQSLGGLGLLLGTIGLGIVLVRNVVERRGELATLRAFGFRRASLARMVLAENGFLLAVGVMVGTVSALAGVAPRLAVVRAPWGALAATLAIVFLVGMLSSIAAVAGALRVPLLPELKTER